MAHMVHMWMTIDADFTAMGAAADPGAPGPEKMGDGAEGAGDRGGQEDPLQGVPDAARDWVRESVTFPMRRYNARGGKSLYIDKSLDSVYHLPLVHGLFPETRCIVLVRHVMDTVASGLDASPWGFNAFGYGPYVQASPGNTVAALAQYWLTHVTTALAWEETHRDRCHRVRYEDLVLNPEGTVREIEKFLGVTEDIAVIARALKRPLARGPGDYKVTHTNSVHAASIGHGKRVPVAMLPPPLRDALNEKLEALGYPALTPAWNAEERPVDQSGEGIWAERLTAFMQDVRLNGTDHEGGSFALLAEDHRALRWVVDFDAGRVTQGDGNVDHVITGTAEALVLMLHGEENLGALVRTGRIRHLTAGDAANSPSVFEEGTHVVAVLQAARGLGAKLRTE
jgi:hypothetical protein